MNIISKDKSVFNYVCNERLALGVKCKAKAAVTNCDIPGGVEPILSKVDTEHECLINLPKAVEEEMRHEMKEMVRKEPHKTCI